MVRFVSLRVRLEDPGLSYIFAQVAMEFYFESYYMDPPLYWSWLFYHLIMDLCFCLVAMIVFSRYSLPWICIVLVSSHVMSYMRFESVVLQQIPANILALDFFSFQSIHYRTPLNSCFGGHSVTSKSCTLDPCVNPFPNPLDSLY